MNIDGIGSKCLAACAAMLYCAAGAEAADIAYTGANDGAWDTASNWTPAQVPTAADDVTISGKSVVLASGTLVANSVTLSGGTITIGSSSARDNIAADISGNLTLTGASKLYVYAGTFSDLDCFTNDTTAAAAIFANANVIRIGGTFSVGDTSVVYPDNDRITGTPVFFKTKDFSLASGASFNTVKRGWGWTTTVLANAHKDGSYYSLAFGAGLSYGSAGGAYGGNSGTKTTSGGKNYGYAYGYQHAPFLPGSPNGCHYGATLGSGSICIFASGNAEVNGMLNADGEAANVYGGPSGGGIWLVAKTMTIHRSAKLTAVGGKSNYGSAGGGGRIALGAGLSDASIAALAAGEEPALSYADLAGVNAIVTGGAANSGSWLAPSGTVKLVADLSVSQPVHLTATPVEYEKGTVSPNYGLHVYEADAIPAFTAPAGTFPEVYQNQRQLVNNGAVTNDVGPLRTVTWQWENEQCLVRFAPVGNGMITANDVDYTTAGEAWFATGSTLTLSATPDADEAFRFWAGDFAGMTNAAASVQITIDKAMTIDALFTGATPATKTFVGESGGFWHVPANWEPAGVPSLGDDVIINAKTVYCNGIALVNSISQTGGALVIGGNTTTVETQATRTDTFVPWAGLYALDNVTVAGGSFSLGARRTDYPCQGAFVGGNLLASGTSKVCFYASESAQADFASLYANATKVIIDGVFAVSNTAAIYVEADGLSGNPVKFEVGDGVSIASTAKIIADARGWYWYAYDSTNPDPRPQRRVQGSYFTLAPGYGLQYNQGGAYGIAGEKDASFRRDYGYKYAPFLPGSPASSDYSGLTSRPGGAIWIETPGVITLDGQMTANASHGSSTHSSSSGGGIWLVAKKIVAGASASLSAKGGDGYGVGNAGGTGGRISLAIGVGKDDLAALARGEKPDNLTYSDEITSVTTVALDGGYNHTTDGIRIYAPAGTATTVLGEVDEFDFTVVSSPEGLIAENVAYETVKVQKGATVTRTAPAYAYLPGDVENVRYSNAGWVVSNVTEQVASGDGLTAEFTANSGPLTLTWFWNNRETRASYAPNDSEWGEVLVNGAQQASTETWSAEAQSVSLVPVAKEGYEFLYWTGDVPKGMVKANPFVMPTAEPLRVMPVFRRIESPATRTWVGGATSVGAWIDPQMWDPAGNIPGPADTVVFTNGYCSVSNYLECANLSAANSTILRVAQFTTAANKAVSVTSDNVSTYPRTHILGSADVIVTGNLSLSDSAQLGMGARRGKFPCNISVGGNLTLSGSSKLHLVGGMTNGVDVTHATGGSRVDVGGTFAVRDTAVVYPESEYWTGGTPVFRVGKLIVEEDASFNADSHGYDRAVLADNCHPLTLAKGSGYDFYVGASHGGKGGSDANNAGVAPIYDFANSPVEPGGCKGEYSNGVSGADGFRGGGLIRIHVTGKADIAGTLTARAYRTGLGQPWGGGTAGGGIWVTASNFAFGENAQLIATGGDIGGGYGSAGGGGRIALGRFLSKSQIEAMSLSADLPKGIKPEKVFDYDGFTGYWQSAECNLGPVPAVSLAGGKDGSNNRAGTGTFRFVDGNAPGTMLLLK